MTQGRVSGHKDLRVWNESMKLAVDVYTITRRMPVEERYGLTSQIRRSAASVPANIAEGAGRSSSRDFARCLYLARGSLSELETHLLLCEELKFLPHVAQLHEQIQRLRTMLTRLSSSLLRRSGAA